MQATAEAVDTSALVGAHASLSPLEVLGEDAHWQLAHRREGYYQDGLDYEDYAPAYCVGYMGFLQYGGRFDDAERSLWANWERIKGDSRLSLDHALPAMRAAWARISGQPSTQLR